MQLYLLQQYLHIAVHVQPTHEVRTAAGVTIIELIFKSIAKHFSVIICFTFNAIIMPANML